MEPIPARTPEEIAAALEAGERLMAESWQVAPLSTWFGEIDLQRLNDVRAYLQLSHPFLALMTDLWVAHVLGWVPLKLKRRKSFNRPAALARLIASLVEAGAGKGQQRVQVAWQDALLLNHYVSVGVPPGSALKPSKQGLIEFVRALHAQG